MKRGYIFGVVLMGTVFSGCQPKAERSENEEKSEPVVEVEQPAAEEDAPDALESLLAAIGTRDYNLVERLAARLEGDFPAEEVARLSVLSLPVMEAAKEGNIRLFEALKVVPPVLGFADDYGRKAIHIAAARDHSELLKYLVNEAGLEVNDKNGKNGWTALHYAGESGSEDSIELLLDLNADPRLKSNLGQTALHVAVKSENEDTTSSLLASDVGSDLVNEVDDQGRTALHFSAEWGGEQIAEILVQAGADKAVKDAEGLTAKDVAMRYGNEHMLSTL